MHAQPGAGVRPASRGSRVREAPQRSEMRPIGAICPQSRAWLRAQRAKKRANLRSNPRTGAAAGLPQFVQPQPRGCDVEL